MDFKKIFWFIFIPLLACGFRIIPGVNTWDIDNTSTTRAKLFVSYPTPNLSLTNDLPTGDVLAGTSTITVQQAMNAIFNDYNNIQGAFVTLVDDSDADYTANKTNRTIEIVNGTTSAAASAGGAQPSMQGGKMIHCTITFEDRIFKNAKEFTASVTHEMGHCLGLNHPMDTVNSIMSYFVDTSITRLQIDDKMGIVYLYPVNKSKATEEATYGFSCSRK